MNQSQASDSACTMVIFGGTGDLTQRKLMPAIYYLSQANLLPESFAVVAVSRQSKNLETYHQEICESIETHSRFKPKTAVWSQLKNRIFFYSLDFTNEAAYHDFQYFLAEIDSRFQTRQNLIFYLAVAPEYFEIIIERLQKFMIPSRDGNVWRRVVIEKPFGRDLASAAVLNRKIAEVFPEKDIYRIDHYLGKEMLQNILTLRFANTLFEPIWNNHYIDNIQITSAETDGVETRGNYYETSGAIRDMIQNHLLQLLALTAMEPPISLDAEAIRDEKVKVLRCLQPWNRESLKQNIVRGQYGPAVHPFHTIPGYRQEPLVEPDSTVETYVALKTQINNLRWGNMPFYLRTGKRLPVKSTEIIIEFKALPEILFKKLGKLETNLLVIKIQPLEGVFFQINTKSPGTTNTIAPVQMEFCQNCYSSINSPEAYERLIYDLIRGDSTLFTRWDEVENAWQYVDPILRYWQEQTPDFPNYPSGTWGPAEAALLLERDGRQWLQV